MIVEDEAELNDDTLLAEKMLLRHKVSQLSPYVRMEDKNGVCFWYDITGYISLKDYCRTSKINHNLIKRLFSSLLTLQERMLELYLKTEHLLLNMEQIYVSTSGESVMFCYLPTSSVPINEQLSNLTEEMLPFIDHDDKLAVKLGYGIYDEASHENGSIWEFLLNSGSEKKDQTPKVEIKADLEEEPAVSKLPAKYSFSRFKIPEFLNVKRFLPKRKKKEDIYEFCFEPEEIVPKKTNPTTYVGPGAAPMGKFIYQGATGEDSFSVNKESFLIGRSNPMADAMLNCAGASRNHAIVTQVGGEYFIEDLNSKNGTFLNGELLEFKTSVKLTPYDKVRFATEDFIFY
ncbi:MAG: FHA domain-containing protein [Lachnospiraceae bacterium]|nr:FHA domain-containing protein [Lachnospiraceae bacterium]